MHVEGERGRNVSAGNLFVDEAVGLEVRAESAVFFGDTEREQSGGVKIVVVVERKRRLPVVRCRARREALERELCRLRIALGKNQERKAWLWFPASMSADLIQLPLLVVCQF